MKKNRIVITSFARTPFDSQRGHEFQELTIPEMAVVPVKAAIERSQLGRSDVDAMVMGNCNVNGQASNLGRHVALKAGLDYETALAYTVHRVCGSGFTAVTNCMMEIWSGESKVMVAAGAEMLSHSVVSLPVSYAWTGIPRGGILLGGRWKGSGDEPEEIYGNPGGPGPMVEKAARIHGIGREDSDRFAYESQMKMKKAQESGRFDTEIVPLTVPQTDRRGNVTMVTYDKDLHPKPDTDLEVISKLSPAFEKDGVITAANASGNVDGAAALVMMTEEECKRRGLTPIAYLNAFAYGGVDPTIMGTGPVPAIQKLMAKTGITFDDMDVLEINEAFATQVITCLKMLGQYMDSELYKRLNPNGGAVAIGHPLGCTGVRITATVAEQLRITGKKLGVASACIGGGMGVAILLENAQV
ncbi:MAG: thiolase family protein [Peptococcaceae bacterium]|nr:thiolase family protein [Peptococcaceae bacterium]